MADHDEHDQIDSVELSQMLRQRLDDLSKLLGEKDGTIKTLTTNLASAEESFKEYEGLFTESQKENGSLLARIKELTGQLEEARLSKKKFKTDAAESREKLHVAEQQIADCYAIIADVFFEIESILSVHTKVSATVCDADESKFEQPLVKAIFVCCGTGHHENKNLQRFLNLQKMLPMIDFGDEPKFILTDSNRPSLPDDIDAIVLFAAGLTHGDTSYLRNRSDGVHIFSHNYSLASLAQEIGRWLDSKVLATVVR